MTIVTWWGHACVRLERGGARLVIDPGTFSDLSVLDAAAVEADRLFADGFESSP